MMVPMSEAAPYTLASAYVDSLLALVDAYKAVASVSDSTVSKRSLSDSMFVPRLRKGESVTLDKATRLENWLRAEVAKFDAAAAETVATMEAETETSSA